MNEIEFLQNFITKLLKNNDPVYGLHTRADYVDHVQGTARLASKILFSITGHQKNVILASLNYDYPMDSYYQILTLVNKILDEETGSTFLFELLKEYLGYADMEFDEAELKSMCDVVPYLILNLDLSAAVSIATNFQSYRRALYFHWHEASYVLLQALEYNQGE